jgi:HNH endonuclease
MEENAKTCTKCGLSKPQGEFYKRAKSLDGFQPCCKVCDGARRKSHYEANKETALAKQKARYYADPEPRRAYSRKWHRLQMETNPELVREKARKKRVELYAANPEHYREAARRWRASNPEKVQEINRASHHRRRQWEQPQVKEYKRKWRAANPELKAAAQVRYRARKKTPKVLMFTPEQLTQRLSMFSGCWMCGGPATEKDHVKPLEKGGAHMLCNIRPGCRSCNATKNAKWPISTRTKYLAAA